MSDKKEASKIETAMRQAAKKANPADMTRLLDKGANINSTDLHGYTALHLAAGEGRGACVDILLKRGANVDARCAPSIFTSTCTFNGGQTPLMIAAQMSYPSIVQKLLAAGADPKAKSDPVNVPVYNEGNDSGHADGSKRVPGGLTALGLVKASSKCPRALRLQAETKECIRLLTNPAYAPNPSPAPAQLQPQRPSVSAAKKRKAADTPHVPAPHASKKAGTATKKTATSSPGLANFCPHCGNAFAVDAKFCSRCGKQRA